MPDLTHLNLRQVINGVEYVFYRGEWHKLSDLVGNTESELFGNSEQLSNLEKPDN